MIIDIAYPNDNWSRVEIFRVAYGRLPSKKSDLLTQKTFDLFCDKTIPKGRRASWYHRDLVFQIKSKNVLT